MGALSAFQRKVLEEAARGGGTSSSNSNDHNSSSRSCFSASELKELEQLLSNEGNDDPQACIYWLYAVYMQVSLLPLYD